MDAVSITVETADIDLRDTSCIYLLCDEHESEATTV